MQRGILFYQRLSGNSASLLEGIDQVSSVKRLRAELPNIRSAVQWAIEIEDSEEAAKVLQIIVQLNRFFNTQGKSREALSWVYRLIPIAEPAMSHLERQWAAFTRATFEHNQGLYQDAKVRYGNVVEAAKELDSTELRCRSIMALGHVAGLLGEYDLQRSSYANLLQVAKSSGDERSQAAAYISIAHLEKRSNRPEAANLAIERALEICRRKEFKTLLANALLESSCNEALPPHLALNQVQEALHLFLSIGFTEQVCSCYRRQAEIYLALGQSEEAGRSLVLSLEIQRLDYLETVHTSEYLELAAEILLLGAKPNEAIILLSAAQRLRRSLSATAYPSQGEKIERVERTLREALGESAEDFWKEGQSLGAKDAVERALSNIGLSTQKTT